MGEEPESEPDDSEVEVTMLLPAVKEEDSEEAAREPAIVLPVAFPVLIAPVVLPVLVALLVIVLFAPRGLLFAFGCVRPGFGMVRMMPQIYKNYLRKSTEGVALWAQAMDFSAACCALLQLLCVGLMSLQLYSPDESASGSSPVEVLLAPFIRDNL